MSSSWNDLWDKPISFLPSVYSYAMFIVLGICGIFAAIGLFGAGLNISEEQFISFGVFILVAVVITVIASVHVTAVTIATIGNVALGKNITVKRSFTLANKMYVDVFKLLVARLILFLPVLIITGILALPMFISEWFLVLPIGAFIITTILYGVGLLFLEPMFFKQRAPTMTLIKNSIELLKKDTKHLFITFLLVLAISIGISMVLSIAAIPFELMGMNTTPFSIIQIIINIIITVWLSIFTFKAFFLRYK